MDAEAEFSAMAEWSAYPPKRVCLETDIKDPKLTRATSMVHKGEKQVAKKAKLDEAGRGIRAEPRQQPKQMIKKMKVRRIDRAEESCVRRATTSEAEICGPGAVQRPRFDGKRREIGTIKDQFTEEEGPGRIDS
ncbi:hypothetical protein SAY87_014744 [Trapa incisa]|uniref:Uncharacterized protein n=1 Tax=Trapa incisa TaxID=236973 RepID=A0AAN7GW26_9MYRT|nr:hypothetical protein SAY87_014744 [Trapa incisa]